MIYIRRLIQALSLFLFLGLLAATSLWGYSGWGSDFFLRLDPSLAGLTALSAGTWPAGFWPALLVLASALILGRAFCGYVCPLGATLDAARCLVNPRKKRLVKGSGPLRLKYLVLAVLIGAGLLGVSLVFFASPMSLLTRFYALLIQPVIMLAVEMGLDLIRPLIEAADFTSLALAQVKPQRFATQMFILFFFALMFGMARLAPRAWCRWFCPAGAILGLCSKRPLLRRRVNDRCTQCGLCAQACPLGAIPVGSPEKTSYSECQLCRTCKKVCPEDAVSFVPAPVGGLEGSAPALPARRDFLKAGAGGLGLALAGLSGLESPLKTGAPASVGAPGLLRPPGALPEEDFLSLCVRCGQCMAVCPTNALQPIWLDTGWLGLFSASLAPRRGYCDAHCNLCGRVCPSGAIRDLALEERRWSRSGAASINRATCLAWEQQKPCMVCDEVCPYKAIHFEKRPGSFVPVPRVVEHRCAGCGSCEHFCPVRGQAAITVNPQGAVRLSRGSAVDYGKAKGLTISLKKPLKEKEPDPSSPAPGFTD